MKTILVLFGGCSTEYEVSLQSAYAVIQALDRSRYIPLTVGITREGRWLRYRGALDHLNTGDWQVQPECVPCTLSLHRNERQLLLSPVVVNTSAQEYQAVLEHQSLVQSLGFDWDLFGNHSFLLREVPLLLAHLDVRDLYLDIAQKLCQQKQHISTDLYEELLHSMACRSAVKAHDDTKPEELQALLEEVVKNDEIRHCPHGRPVMISFSKQELERRFGRIQ